ncbi:hypothetical protein SADUNF_Sadunf06G0165700 [Salix dunnii]|uniref:Uncharacterized protein n=1 Tax=Salix dunnii TaxID=1413687 RepID=A0A835K565_9ROSI|nr:hypothetical protein SADUNF_Sadunf06G0165700 [Salix dunnii]
MSGKKIVSFKKLAKKVKDFSRNEYCKQSHHECLLRGHNFDDAVTTPTGFFAIYVGEERERFVAPIRCLSHPLFKMLLEKSYDEFGFQQGNGLVVPCNVSTFQEVLNAVECCNGGFDFGNSVEEFLSMREKESRNHPKPLFPNCIPSLAISIYPSVNFSLSCEDPFAPKIADPVELLPSSPSQLLSLPSPLSTPSVTDRDCSGNSFRATRSEHHPTKEIGAGPARLSRTSQLEKKMSGKKIVSFKKLAKKVRDISRNECKQSHRECLLRGHNFDDAVKTPTGFFAIYVGEDRERFVAPTSCLSHPLFKMLLEKSYNEFGFEQGNGLVVPCSVSTFQEVLNAVECCNGGFDFGNLVEEFL